MAISQIGTASISGLGYGFKNRIINGAMMIDQRNAGASITANDATFPVDRFKMACSQSSKLTAQQNAGSVTLPIGFSNYLGLTSSSAYSVGASDYFVVTHFIEGFNVADLNFGTANAATVTLSFWVRSSLTGTFGGAVRNSNAGTRSYPFSYTISAANTWEQKSITIAGDTTGTWNTTNGQGFDIRFGLGVGSTYSGTAGSWSGSNFLSATGATSVVGTSGATFYITGVQIEKGSTATSFDYRPYGTELALCQRYYYQINGNSFVGTALYGMMGSGMVFTSTQADISIPLKVSMRSTPTISQSTTVIQVGGTLYSVTGIGDAGSTPNVVFARLSNAGSMTVGYGANFSSNNNTSGYFAASAEL